MRSSPAPISTDGAAGNLGGLARASASRRERVGIRLPWWAILLGITGGGLALRLHHLGTLPLWVDEGFSARAAAHSYAYLWSVLPKFEFNPPAYYMILKAWTSLLGAGTAGGTAGGGASSEAALRLLSVIFNVATIPLVFLIGRVLGGQSDGRSRKGLFAAGLFALSGLQLQYAQEARGYALLTFVVALAALAALSLMRGWKVGALAGGQDGGRLGAQGPSFRRWAALGVLLGLIPWIHHTGAIAVFALVLPLAYWWVAGTHRDRKVLQGLLAAAAVCALVLVPDVVSLLGRAADVHRGYWIQKPDARYLLSTLLDYAGAPFTGASEGVAVLVLLLAAAGIRHLRAGGGAGAALLLVCLGLVPPLAEIAVSYAVMPVFLPRTFLYASLPLALLAGCGVEALRAKYRALIVIILAPLLCLNAAGYFEKFSKEPWRDVVSHLSARTSAGQPVFHTNTSPGWVMPYYMERQGAAFAIYGVPFRQADFWQGERDDNMLQDTGRKIDAADIERVRALMAGQPRVGVVLKGPEYSDPRQMLVGEVRTQFHLVDTRHFSDGITVLIFDRGR